MAGTRRVLITGGAGFIGSHLSDALLAAGHQVRVLDDLCPQVHGPHRERPAYLARDVELRVGDVRDRDAVLRALDGIDAVYHFAARVGVGQSMYDVAEYTSVNNLGTAVLMEALARHPVERLVVASSMSIYGEGLYRTPDGRLVTDAERAPGRLAEGDWEPKSPSAGGGLEPLGTPESKPPALASVYALSKYDQERLCLVLGRAYRIPTVALRFFNAYGPRQALSNPYTGVLAIFASRLLNDRAPLVFEDGEQKRDFVAVEDVARACALALEKPEAVGRVFNVGSGRASTVKDIAQRLSKILGKPIAPEISGKYRVGDIRHCFADIGETRKVLGYEPQVRLEDGLVRLAEWLKDQAAVDRVDEMAAELSRRGLTL